MPQRIIQGNTRRAKLTGLKPDTSYRVFMRTIYNERPIDSESIEFVTGSETALPVITNFRATAKTTTTLSIAFTISGANLPTSVTLRYGSATVSIATTSAGNKSIKLTGLTPGAIYYCYLYYVHASVTIVDSARLSIALPNVATTYNTFTGSGVSNSSISVRWSRVGYRPTSSTIKVYVGSTLVKTVTVSGSSSGTSIYSLPGRGLTYNLRIKGYYTDIDGRNRSTPEYRYSVATTGTAVAGVIFDEEITTWSRSSITIEWKYIGNSTPGYWRAQYDGKSASSTSSSTRKLTITGLSTVRGQGSVAPANIDARASRTGTLYVRKYVRGESIAFTIDLYSRNDHISEIATYRNHLYVLDYSDRKVYVYSLSSSTRGTRVPAREVSAYVGGAYHTNSMCIDTYNGIMYLARITANGGTVKAIDISSPEDPVALPANDFVFRSAHIAWTSRIPGGSRRTDGAEVVNGDVHFYSSNSVTVAPRYEYNQTAIYDYQNPGVVIGGAPGVLTSGVQQQFYAWLLGADDLVRARTPIPVYSDARHCSGLAWHDGKWMLPSRYGGHVWQLDFSGGGRSSGDYQGWWQLDLDNRQAYGATSWGTYLLVGDIGLNKILAYNP